MKANSCRSDERTAITEVESKLVTLNGITWEQFQGIAAELENNRNVRLTYLAGLMEILSPIFPEHEYIKRTLNLLLEAYMSKKGIQFYALGGFAISVPGYASGISDDAYSFGSRKQVPDIVIEVMVASGTIDKRELYKPKQVPEVWFWKSDQLRVFCLREGEYEEVDRSTLLPDLDLSLLQRYLGHPDQYKAVNEFLQAIGKG